MRILLTGASGFVGGALQARLLAEGRHILRCALRRLPAVPLAGAELCQAPDLGPDSDWRAALQDCDAVIHAAARVHQMHETGDVLAAHRAANLHGTLALARQAAAAGVRRFVFISTVKVNGEGTRPGQPFRADDEPAPCDPYGIAKHEAELALRELAAATGMQLVIVRPVLVYGPGVRANFRSLLRALQRGIPLPLGRLDNRRSLVALDNLVDLILVCLEHPAAAGQTFLASDGEDLSTTELLRRLGQALGRPARLLPVPPRLLEAAARLLGRRDIARRLCGSLQVDIDKNRRLLGWTPPHSVDSALQRTARDFLEQPR